MQQRVRAKPDNAEVAGITVSPDVLGVRKERGNRRDHHRNGNPSLLAAHAPNVE
jgi:hypothetical protein